MFSVGLEAVLVVGSASVRVITVPVDSLEMLVPLLGVWVVDDVEDVDACTSFV